MKNLCYLFLVFLFTFFTSCENEPIAKADPSKVIQVDSELYNLVLKAASNDFENEINCIDFNYSFTLVIYDENMDIFGYQIIQNDTEFSDFLGTLEDGKSISLSYPITSILENGQPFEINSNEELKEAIDKCLEADTLGTCNNILTTPNCIWKTTHLEGPNPEYDGAYFETSTLGNVGFLFNDHSYGGTWITYFIENELHLNIFIIGDENVSNDWNFDWKVISLNETEVEISNGTDRFLLTKECIEPCNQFLFEECEAVPGSGSAIFPLENYSWCFFPLTGLPDPASVIISYYETYEDMLAGLNPITDLQYENTINPQIIYIRFDDINTGLIVTSLPIILKAVSCN